MLSVSNITAGQAVSYYEKDDYYVRDEGGIWQGQLKDKLGLDDKVNKEDFDRLISMNPKRAGFDLCFSAPKSVSLAFCLDEHRDSIMAAHNKAVEDTLKLIENNEIFVRVTEDKVTRRVQVDNMLCAKFNHYVSRNQDPQIHTHCVVLNHSFLNGKRYAISNENLYENKLLYGQIYRNYLANNLQNLGFNIEVTDREKGFFELAGVDREAIEKFSTRRQEIVESLERMGEYSSKSAEVAAMKTRKAKEHMDFNILLGSWKSDLKEFGFSVDRVEIGNDLSNQKRLILGFEKAKNIISNQTFAFTDKEYYKEALRHSLGTGATINDVEEYLKQQVDEKKMYFLGVLDNRRYYCTKESYDLEQSIFRHVEEGKGALKGIGIDDINAFISDTTLNEEQKEAVRHICGTSDRFTAVIGLAGTGKTYMLKHAKEVFEKDGYKLYGMSLAGQAAHNLQAESGIESRTIHSFLNMLEKEAGNFDHGQDLENKDKWSLSGLKKVEKEVWIVDEAGMVNNNLFNELCKAAEARNAKVVFVGDNKQLQAIGAGSSFDNLIRKDRINYVTMEEIRRQKDKELKEAVTEAVKGDVRRSLDILASKTEQIDNREERLKKLAADYSFQSSEDRHKSIILTGSNYDRHEINKYVRENLKSLGLLENGHVFILEAQNGNKMSRELAINDKIMFLKNDKDLGVKNGQVGYIKNIIGNDIWLETDNKVLKVDVDEYKYLDYGYAMTVHKAQGQTVDKAFVHINTDQKKLNSRNSYYVDISRAKYDVKIYTNDKERLYKAVSKFDIKLSSDDFSFKREVKGISSTDWLKFKQEHMDLDRNLQLKKEIHMG